jgi:hypothetical protein
MNQEMKVAEKCSSCGQPIPDAEPACPNCGRKRRTPITVPSWPAAKKPLVAQFCTALAWIAIIPGSLLLIAGIGDFMSNHPAAVGEATAGGALIFSPMIWFVAARVITLLAQIAHNTRPQKQAAKSSE